jgi:hypothetical protein
MEPVVEVSCNMNTTVIVHQGRANDHLPGNQHDEQ